MVKILVKGVDCDAVEQYGAKVMFSVFEGIRTALGIGRCNNAEMRDEISAAALWWSNALRDPGRVPGIPEPIIESFHHALRRHLRDYIAASDPHGRSWRPEDPRTGSYSRTFAASVEDGVSPTSAIALAAADAGISDIGSRLPRKVLMRIDPGYVEVAGVGVVWGEKP